MKTDKQSLKFALVTGLVALGCSCIFVAISTFYISYTIIEKNVQSSRELSQWIINKSLRACFKSQELGFRPAGGA